MIAETDLKMQHIRQEMGEAHAEPSEAEAVFEKLKKLGLPLLPAENRPPEKQLKKQ